MSPDKALLHAANAVLLASFLVRDILWLRVLSVLGGGLFLASFCLPAPPLWDAIAWNLVFFAINAAQIARLVLERRPVRLSEDEHALRELVFRRLSPREVRALAAGATFRDAAGGEQLVRRGEPLPALFVVLAGSLDVMAGGARVATLGAGRFAGEMSFLTGEAPSADVVVAEPARVAAFDPARLRALLDARPELRSALQAILGADLAEKLRAHARE